MTVTFGNLRTRDGDEILRLTGLPYLNLPDVIYLELSWGLQGIPKAMITDIQGARMPPPPPKELPMEQPEPFDEPTLALDDPKFERFATAVLLEERVRVHYLARVPNDPAMGDNALTVIPTMTEGRAAAINETWLHLATGIEQADMTDSEREFILQQKFAIPRVAIQNLVFLGPRPVPASEMV